jgi:hypothetical protein
MNHRPAGISSLRIQERIMIDAVVDACRRSKAHMPRHLLGYQAKMPRIAVG